MIVYTPRKGEYGSHGQALREAEALVEALRDPVRFSEFAAKFPGGLVSKHVFDYTLITCDEEDGHLVIAVCECPEPPERL
ncbi:hypothetical protein F3I62_03580 [Pseudomonas sp. R-28-1W-6]|uniref:hypothetical protein n=1 Tax=Pseudomonas sp. R-28-1W-6 TaxID=2650101 RepID=UPI0013667D41|nr:hypothetical protein [Pseudomonas sp. R-28-1W-6]MWV11169.1 hypothetical protein [Pseudomonas sp. R-28-1W-6]